MPGLWTMQGFAPPQYTNVQMPFDEQPPNVPPRNPTGIFRRRFARPEGERVVLHFGGSEGALFVELNGEPVGIHKDARTPAEFDVTDLLEDDNELVCAVVQWSDASFVEDQDQWWHGGLPRDVFLYATPREYIADVFARGFADGRFEVDAPGELRLLDPDGRTVLGRAGATRAIRCCGRPRRRTSTRCTSPPATTRCRARSASARSRSPAGSCCSTAGRCGSAASTATTTTTAAAAPSRAS